MEVDIYIKEVNGSREIRIPWLPEKIECNSNGTRMVTYEILDVGEVDVPSGRNLSTFSWSSTFPGEGHRNLPFLRGSWQDPKKLQTILSQWRVNGTPLRLLVTGTPINHDVYLKDYDFTYEHGYGDYQYDIVFKARSEIQIIATKSSTVAQKTSTGASVSTYTVKSGDTLWSIAEKYLGSGARYKEIYNLNKSIIEQTAKKHGFSSSDGGHWIFPGTVLKLPTSATTKTTSNTGGGGKKKPFAMVDLKA